MQTFVKLAASQQPIHAGLPGHLLQRAGLSILIDLDRLEAANRLSAFFLLTALICFLFMKAILALIINRRQASLGDAACQLYTRAGCPLSWGREIARIQLLAFPRILGIAFNPITIYLFMTQKTDPVLCLCSA